MKHANNIELPRQRDYGQVEPQLTEASVDGMPHNIHKYEFAALPPSALPWLPCLCSVLATDYRL